MKGKKRRGRFSWVPNFYLILVLLILYLPTFVVVAYSFNQQKDGLKWTGFTTEWYPKLFQTRQIMEAMRNSLIVAGASCLIAAVVGTLGGKFDIASTLGQGTTVTVTLPVYHPGQEHLHDKI